MRKRGDLSNNILSLAEDAQGCESKLTVELGNEDAGFALLPPPLDIGCRLDFQLWLYDRSRQRNGRVQSYTLRSYEYVNTGGTSRLVLYAANGWENVCRWTAKQQYRLNQVSDDMSSGEYWLSHSGKSRLETGDCFSIGDYRKLLSDFNINPGTTGDNAVKNCFHSYRPAVYRRRQRLSGIRCRMICRCTGIRTSNRRHAPYSGRQIQNRSSGFQSYPGGRMRSVLPVSPWLSIVTIMTTSKKDMTAFYRKQT